MNYAINQEGRAFKFLVSSSVLHGLLFALAFVVSALVPVHETSETVEIKILDSAVELPAPTPVPVAAAAVAPPAKMAEAPKSPVMPKPMPKGKGPRPTLPAKPRGSMQAQARAMPTATHAAKAAPVPVSAEDLETALQSDVEIASPKQSFNDKEIAQDFDKVDKEQAAKVTAMKKELQKTSDAAMADQEESLQDIKNQTQEQDKALAEQAAQIQQADQARVQQAMNNEQQAAAAAAAKQAAEEAQGALLAEQMARGQSLGVNTPVKSLSEIRGYPGNKPPQYESADRLEGRQGEVAFLAYVAPNGQVTEMKLLKSTGHRSLDAKTLAAIRKWKFYPGQQGWVEVPFKWDLKGGPQEMPATLRRSSTNF